MKAEKKQIQDLIGKHTLLKFNSLIDGIVTYKTVAATLDDKKGWIGYEIQMYSKDNLCLLSLDTLISTYGSDIEDLELFEVYEVYPDGLTGYVRNKIYNKFGE